MSTIYDIKERAQQLSEKTDAESISPAEVGSLFSDLADYTNDVDINGSSLGIRKTYTSVSAMEADKNPVGDDGKPLKKGQLVNIYNQDDPSSADNNKVFSWQNPGWQIRTTLDAGYATREELTELETKTEEIGYGSDTFVVEKTSSDYSTLLIPFKIKKRGLYTVEFQSVYSEYVGQVFAKPFSESGVPYGTVSNTKTLSFIAIEDYDSVSVYVPEFEQLKGGFTCRVKYDGIKRYSDIEEQIQNISATIQTEIGYPFKEEKTGIKNFDITKEVEKGQKIFLFVKDATFNKSIQAFGIISRGNYDLLYTFKSNTEVSVIAQSDYISIRFFDNNDNGLQFTAGLHIKTYTEELKEEIPEITQEVEKLSNQVSLLIDYEESFSKENISVDKIIEIPEYLLAGRRMKITATSITNSMQIYLLRNDLSYISLGSISPTILEKEYVMLENFISIKLYAPNGTIFSGNIIIDGVNKSVERINNDIQPLIGSLGIPRVLSCNIIKRFGGIGDSYMAGHIQPRNQEMADPKNYEYAWPCFLSKLTGNTFTNFAVSGSTAKQWVNTSLFNEVEKEGNKCQAYCIALMINDQGDWSKYATPCGTKEDIGTEADTYYAYYYKLIQKVIAINPDAKIFCFTCFVYEDNFEYNVAVRDIVDFCKNKGQNVYLVDTAKYRDSSYFKNTIFNADACNGHYTAIGYNFMAECHYKLISDVINNNVVDFENVYKIPFDL